MGRGPANAKAPNAAVTLRGLVAASTLNSRAELSSESYLRHRTLIANSLPSRDLCAALRCPSEQPGKYHDLSHQ